MIRRRVMTARRAGARVGLLGTESVTTADERLIARLRAGDESAFLELLDAYGPLMFQLALGHVRTPAVAEEVVQEAWMGVIKGLERFEGRSSLKTWILRILVNIARTRGARESRCTPFSSLAGDDDDGPALDPERFLPAEHPRWPGHWAVAAGAESGLPTTARALAPHEPSFPDETR